MFYISDIYTTSPEKFESQLQEKVYRTLNELCINFGRVETDVAITMGDCVEINKKLVVKMVKTLFLCNRQKTNFYLFVTCGDKRFDSKKFSSELKIARVSFADESLMKEMLGTEIGATTIFSSLIDNDNKVEIVIDRDVLNEKYYGCSDGTTTNYIKIEVSELINRILPYSNHKETIIEMC